MKHLLNQLSKTDFHTHAHMADLQLLRLVYEMEQKFLRG